MKRQVSVMTNRNQGFTISHNPMNNLCLVRVWGRWEIEVGTQFERAFRTKIQQEVGLNGTGWRLLLDFTHCPPQSQDIQNLFNTLLVFAKQQGMKKKAILANGAGIPLQTDQLSQDPELKIHFYFQSEADAVRWLLNG